MRTVSNIIGRILLLGAAILIGVSVAIEMIAALGVLNDPAIGWWNWGNQQGRAAMLVFFLAILNAIVGLTALFAAIRGRRSFWLFVFALILMISPVYTIVTGVQAGTLTGTWEQIGKLILQFLIPIAYFVGCILLVRPAKP